MYRLPKPWSCIECPLYEQDMRQGFTETEGSGTLGVMMVGESAGFFESRDGLPFRPAAPAGSVLERALRRLGFDRQQFLVTNILRCRPPGDKLDRQPYEISAVSHCAVYRDKTVADMRPRCILALGGLPLKWLTGFAGKFQTIHYMRGYVLDGTMYPGIPVVPTFHPSFLRQGAMHLFGVLCHDIKLAVEVSRSGAPNKTVPTYATEPTEDQVAEFYQRLVADPSRLVAYDIETPTSAHLSEDERDSDPSYQIVQVQFSDAPDTGIALSWSEPYIGWAKRILALPNPKVGHNNWNYDDLRLRAAGCVINGRVDDTMWVFHHLQPDLPAHLQFVGSFYGMQTPWKHRSEENLAWYGCADVDACQHILPKAMEDLRRRGLLEGYERHMRSLQPILQAMGDRGIPINSEARQEFQDAMKAEEDSLFDQVQQYVPEECRNVHPKQGYKRVPADTSGLVRRSFPVTVDVASGESVVTVDQTEERWCRLEPFNPGSWQQLIRYMRYRDHPVPRHFKTGDETTEARELRRLEKKTADLLYKVVLDYRAFRKMRSTYAEGWMGRNGRVHSLFTFSPAIGQIASRNPNVQNAPRQGELAKKFRRVVEATSGHRLVEFDWRSFFVLTMGFEAQDPDYIRMARLDMHSFVTAIVAKEASAERMFSQSDDELRDYLAWVKSKYQPLRDDKIKHATLGYGNGLGARGMYQRYMENFESEAECKRLIVTMNSVFSQTALWRERVRHEAQDKGHLTTRFWSERQFFDVLVYWDRWKIKSMVEKGRRPNICKLCGRGHDNGEQAEQAIAYRPANDAFGMKKEVMLALDSQGLLERYRLINEVHDALLFECPDDLVDQCIPDVKQEMERPSKVLVDPVVAPDGLWCGVTVKTGKDWSRMEEVRV